MLLVCREVNKVKAVLATGTFHFFFTLITLDKKKVAGIINTVNMSISRFAALVAVGDHVGADAFAEPLVEHEILS